MIGEELRKRREELGLTAYAVAKKAGMQQTRLKEIEEGRNVNLSTIERICEVLGCKLTIADE